MRISATSLALAAIPVALAQQSAYGQCGGTGWQGDTTCVSGSACVALNPYYSQCQPGAAAPAPGTTLTTSATTAPGTTLRPTTAPTSTARPTTTGSGGASAPSGTGPGATLQSGYYWVRAVEDPNFHKYLQTDPGFTTGPAVLEDPTTAGQFNIVDGQLVELIDPVKGTLLYANVAPQTDASDRTLAVTFSATKNTYGTFAFQGDAVTWSIPSISRPNLSAWYVCANQQLFINLGNYLYETPTGCVDETIHSYGGATAVS